MKSNLGKGLAPPAIGISIACLGLWAWVAIRFDSPRDALRYVQGTRLVVEPRVISFGEAAAGEHREATFVVRNLANDPVTILGAAESCECTTTDQLPVTIPGRGVQEMRLRLHVEGKSTEWISRRIRYYTDQSRHGSFLIRLEGRIR